VSRLCIYRADLVSGHCRHGLDPTADKLALSLRTVQSNLEKSATHVPWS
jgi:hypothetical protein